VSDKQSLYFQHISFVLILQNKTAVALLWLQCRNGLSLKVYQFLVSIGLRLRTSKHRPLLVWDYNLAKVHLENLAINPVNQFMAIAARGSGKGVWRKVFEFPFFNASHNGGEFHIVYDRQPDALPFLRFRLFHALLDQVRLGQGERVGYRNSTRPSCDW